MNSSSNSGRAPNGKSLPQLSEQCYICYGSGILCSECSEAYKDCECHLGVPVKCLNCVEVG